MYKILCILLFLLTVQYSLCQDTIKLRDGNFISARIIEINPVNVKYKKYHTNNDQIYRVKKSAISVVKYSNGLVDTIKPEYLSRSDNFDKIEKFEKRYFLNYANGYKKPVGEREILKIATQLGKERQLPDLLKSVRKVKRLNQNTQGLFACGITVVAMGGMFAVTSLMQYPNAYKADSEVAEFRKIGVTIGLSSLVVGFGLETLSIKNRKRKKRKLSETVDLYNNYLVTTTSPR